MTWSWLSIISTAIGLLWITLYWGNAENHYVKPSPFVAVWPERSCREARSCAMIRYFNLIFLMCHRECRDLFIYYFLPCLPWISGPREEEESHPHRSHFEEKVPWSEWWTAEVLDSLQGREGELLCENHRVTGWLGEHICKRLFSWLISKDFFRIIL